MIAAIHSGVLIALLCLLAFAPPASAGSGWVLWTQEVATEPGRVTEEKVWRRIAAFDSNATCFSDASTRAEGLAYGSDQERKIQGAASWPRRGPSSGQECV